MQTIRLTPASIASRHASAANGGGTKIAEAFASVSETAFATVLKIGIPLASFWLPFPGVTPATTCVP